MFKMCFYTEIYKNTHKVLSKYKKNYFAIWKNKVFYHQSQSQYTQHGDTKNNDVEEEDIYFAVSVFQEV